MKKNLMLIILMMGILVGVSVLVSAALCVDTDGGKNYNTYGEIRNELDVLIYEDYCNGNNLNEMYCSGMVTPNLESYACPNGCSNGACVSGGVSGVGPAEASAGSVAVAKTGTTRTSSTAKARKGWTEVEAADGSKCYIKPDKGKATGRFLGFMFRD